MELLFCQYTCAWDGIGYNIFLKSGETRTWSFKFYVAYTNRFPIKKWVLEVPLPRLRGRDMDLTCPLDRDGIDDELVKVSELSENAGEDQHSTYVLRCLNCYPTHHWRLDSLPVGYIPDYHQNCHQETRSRSH